MTFLSLDPTLQLIIALLFIVSVLSALGVDIAALLFKGLFVLAAGYAIYQHFNILIGAWTAYKGGEDLFITFVSSLHEEKNELAVFFVGYLIIGILAVKEFSERLNFPSFINKILGRENTQQQKSTKA